MIQFKKAAFYTLGCKLNFSETSTISRLFEGGGFAKVDFNEFADIYVINTCSVTENADKKCNQLVKKAKRNNPNSFVIVIGCYAQLKPQQIIDLAGVNMVLGANEKFNIIEHLQNLENTEEKKVIEGEIKKVKEFVPSYSMGDRTRSFLKIQDGCDYFCSFCTIPLARGTSRSNTIEATVNLAKEIAEKGFKEVVLTGVNIGDFGKGTDKNFFNLLKELDKIESINRFRISSIEPNLLSKEIIEFVAQSKKIAAHFHIPLQSGSDRILKSMRRRYDTKLYRGRVQLIKELIPDCCIGVDVIVGSPGETEEDFLATYDFLKELNISYLHVFTYSERANTTAERNTEVVPKHERVKRSKMLHILSDKKKRKFYENNIGKKGAVLCEKENNGEFLNGFTENYVKVKIPFNAQLINQIVPVQLSKIDTDGLFVIDS